MDSIFSILSSVPDFRRGNRLLYPLDYLLLIAFTAIMSGFTTWAEFELYAEIHQGDLKKLYKKLTKKTLFSYTPSHDTFGYVFKALDPDTFKEAFKNWLVSIFEIAGQHISELMARP